MGSSLIASLTQGRLVGAGISALIIAGLLKRSRLTWWLVTFVNALAAMFWFSYAGERGVPALVAGGWCLVTAVLLISCRFRGAYDPSEF